MRLLTTALAALLLLLQVAVSRAGPQNVYYQSPQGQLRQLPNGQKICGDCPPGTYLEPVQGPYCGRCLPTTQSCANGYFMNGGQCSGCPCPEANGGRRFGTSCRVENGEVVCDCPSEYTGRDCSQCAPGAVQNNQYPYNCFRYNNSNSFYVNSPNRQPLTIPQIVQQRPPAQALCPITSRGTGCAPNCPTGGCTPNCPTSGCATNCAPPQIGCGSNCAPPPPPPPPQTGCAPNCQPQCQPPVNPAPWNPVRYRRNVCPGPVPCPPQPAPICQPPPPPQPLPQPCPIQPSYPCPPVQGPCQQCPPIQGPCPACPAPTPCPPCPPIQQPCPVCPPIQQPCPVCPPVQQPCPTCPDVQCPSPCPSPCPTPSCPSPCPNPCPPQIPCQTQCADPCQPCPQIPPCPDCRLQCPPCPTPCQPCGTSNCTNCPNPCKDCPNPCQPCPACIIGGSAIIEPCICDPRGTASQANAECICKVNVQGARCDQCKKGYFALSSTRAEGCLSCFCSGLSDVCSVAPYFRTTIKTSRSADCTIQLTNEDHTIVYSQGSSGFSYDGSQAMFSKSVNRRFFWSLPACLKGDRVTSYGGLLTFSRMCSGNGGTLGADHEVMLVAGSGATVFWTTFEDQKCTGAWTNVEVLLAETAYWSSWKGDQYRRATRGDIMEVLADLQLILVRATFLTTTSSTGIKDVTLSSVSSSPSMKGLALHVENCRCPTGYRGLSCQNCAPGYYRDVTDMSRSVFGACKPCPCSKTSDGCHYSAGQVVCKCKPGFTGPLCQDRETITITCDPFRIREVAGSEIDFTCSYTSNTRRRLLMRLGREGDKGLSEDTTSITRTITLTKDLRRVECEVVDNAGVTWAIVYCAVEIIEVVNATMPPPPRIISVIPTETFICVNETASVTLSCDVHSFGGKKVAVEWRREGSSQPLGLGSGESYTIRNAAVVDAGTYICSASDGEVIGIGQIAVMVRRIFPANYPMLLQYPINATNQIDVEIHNRHGGDFPHYPYQGDEPSDGTNGGDTPQIAPLVPGSPMAVVEPASVVAKPGDTVIIRCNATGEEPLKFYWKSGTNDYIPVHVRVSHGALIFRSLRTQDAGVYYCVAWNHLGQSTARAVINLENQTENEIVEITHPTIEVLNEEIVARPGESVNLQCRTNTTGGRLQWSKIGGEIPKSSEVRTDGVLTLYRVTEKDQGSYLCTVTTPLGEQKSAQTVLKLKEHIGELLVPPRVVLKPKSPMRVRTGSTVRLECESAGTPTPNVTWVRSIDGVDKRLVTTANNKAIYEIKQMSVADVGKYTCNALNAAGRKSESMSLTIDDGEPCGDNEFRCRSADQCISREDRCDGEKDCRDGSDELNCKTSRRVRSQQKK